MLYPRIRSGLARAAVATLLAACGSGSPPAASPGPTAGLVATPAPATTTAAVSHDFIRDVEVDGRKLHVLCVGPVDSGRPTLVFESGLGGDVETWGGVLGEIQKTDRACAYDRLGDGQSDKAPGPRTTTGQVAELRALLAAIEVEPPSVLVGYSVGGWNVLVHNDLHGADVVGAIMADVRPPGVSRRWLEALPPVASDEPEGVRLNRDGITVFEADPSLNPELLDLRKSAA
ncbi:MAG TPA: alpha/beta hydrolase, partial [Candidatus Limnocylindrales bacterium]|nr:alpha/beta hydrolase [Candidatus Limnocylindrales bacterium]